MNANIIVPRKDTVTTGAEAGLRNMFQIGGGLCPIVRPIVMACDESYAMPLATALWSAVQASRTQQALELYVLYDQFRPSLRERVGGSVPKGSVAIHWVPVDLRAFQGCSTLPHISKMTFARFAIPHIFPQNVRRVLYLDADILVLNDLSPLWEIDLKGAVIGAVLDYILDSQIKAGTPGLERFPRVEAYFNAGVLLIDLEKWRKERISETALHYLGVHRHSPLADQDALNVACDGRWTELGLHWNFYDHFHTPIRHIPPEQRPAIVHFTGQKPWKASALSVNAGLYDSYRRETRFARTVAERARDLGSTGWYRVRRRIVKTTAARRIKKIYQNIRTA